MDTAMEPVHDYFSLSEGKIQQRASWGQNNWSNSLASWETTQNDMPIWQYTTAALNHGDTPMAFYPNETPLSPSYTNPSSIPSALNSPIVPGFPQDVRFVPQPLTPLYDNSAKPSTINLPFTKEEELEEDEDSDSISWEPKSSTPKANKTTHRRAQSANEISIRNAKRAHTVVEKNYRERLNDKINDLAQYLFETSSDSRTKPSKSLVMTRAKERLKQLEARNKALETEVVKLRQHIAILDHIVTTGRGEGGVPSSVLPPGPAVPVGTDVEAVVAA